VDGILSDLRLKEELFEQIDSTHQNSQSDSEAEEFLAEEKPEISVPPLQNPRPIATFETKTNTTPKTPSYHRRDLDRECGQE
jgi:hypothetical protein